MNTKYLKLALLLAADVATLATSAQAQGNHYKQTNLVANSAATPAAHVDKSLINPWGIAFGPGIPFWIADNNSGVSTIYDAAGNINSLVVTIPPPSVSSAPATPTGIVFNNTAGFQITDGGVTAPSQFIFSTEDGTIAAWNGTGNSSLAIRVVDNPNFGSGTDPVYKGLAMGKVGQSLFLYAANFRSGKIDVFDSNFQPAVLAGTFRDPNLPAGFAPFGIHNINGQLYVTYAMQDQFKHDPIHAPGAGVVDVFDTSGNMVNRLISDKGALNAPWGVVVAPSTFGQFAGDLLVGNFGDGVINAYATSGGASLGILQDANGQNIVNLSLWDMVFGAAGTGSPNTLYFTAGLANEMGGLFATLDPTQGNPTPAADFTLTATPMNPTETLGGSTTVTIGANATGGFNSAISLACANVPAGITCSFSNPSIVPGGNPSTSKLTLSTNATTYHRNLVIGTRPPNSIRLLLALSALGSLVLLLVSRRGNLQVRYPPLHMLATRATWVRLLAVPLFAAACGGGSSASMQGTPPSMSNLMVTGTSGQISHSLSLTLTVQ
jgi:uncharacterized protein (TIGR03118 family)